jgi:hypothetical protein
MTYDQKLAVVELKARFRGDVVTMRRAVPAELQVAGDKG